MCVYYIHNYLYTSINNIYIYIPYSYLTDTHTILSQIRIISKETKTFSRLLHSQVCAANDLEGLLGIWDGQGSLEDAVADIDGGYDGGDGEGEGEGEGVQDSAGVTGDGMVEVVEGEARGHLGSGDEEGEVMMGEVEADDAYTNSNNVVIIGVIDDLFSYQLSSMPTWQALKHLYTISSLRPYFDTSQNCGRSPIILPGKVRIMMAAVELTDLHRSHGLVGTVNGFPHYSYDVTLTGSGTGAVGQPPGSWSDNLFPYKLAQYNKRLLSHPICIATLDIESFYDDYSIDINGVLDIYENGLCHCVAIYIELDNTHTHSTSYDNTTNTNISAYNNTSIYNNNNNILHGIQSDIGDFPLHHTSNLKFLPEPVNVSRGGTGTGLSYRMKFNYGDSDLLFEFNTVNL